MVHRHFSCSLRLRGWRGGYNAAGPVMSFLCSVFGVRCPGGLCKYLAYSFFFFFYFFCKSCVGESALSRHVPSLLPPDLYNPT